MPWTSTHAIARFACATAITPDCLFHHHLNLLLGRLDEHERRWLAALESERIGRGGDRLLSLVTGLDVETIRRGRRELLASHCAPVYHTTAVVFQFASCCTYSRSSVGSVVMPFPFKSWSRSTMASTYTGLQTYCIFTARLIRSSSTCHWAE